MSEEVDDYVVNKVRPEQQEAVAFLRQLMGECAPEAREVITYGIPGWRRKGMLAVISPAKTHLTFAFSRGSEIEDKYGLLEGAGKVSKHVKVKDISAVNQEALRDYIRRAVELDDQATPTGRGTGEKND